ncbi:UDPglucose 6-dehydrogenase [Anseongella ginsenosidimutans]|uniref:UDP-glucose 6-dehydrogenase n=1 Tax=Anseongella ginsenosidimutans TaxID=496056 RepID=A0A4R3KSP9_9SPHI|nr:UDP-glucose/GDP-mannose dehydrogenase family protein [Anseongella ginsenosidimutans]QEC53354.1 UDP-glucose/GDP-mannose dehydrogenase family protein [Anseongella ginsenosidimutans]TCS88238.1 UDPglucose 6-dehydrogenase [Anseongella ginsenosidimutans]
MKIAVIGTGYVGLVTGACLAETGADVICVDVNEIKIERLKKGIIPIYEPGLDEIVERNYKGGRLQFSTSLRESVRECSVIFIAVGTPPGEDGSADLRHVLQVAREIGASITGYTIVVTKSTVPVGTSAKVKAAIQLELEQRDAAVEFEVASNPEFLKEGSAIDDFLRPDRIVIGTESDRAREILQKLYHPFVLNGHPLLFMDIPSAELTKYAANSMLATKISFMNDIANLCELLGADVDAVRKGIGSDPRIGTRFIYPGIGYGGSCFPKDVKALIGTARENNYELRILQSVDAVNDDQKHVMFAKIRRHFGGELAGKTIAVWGIAFKPNTDDIREAPALVLIESLLAAGANVQVYDPVAMTEARYVLSENVLFASSALDAVKGAHALALVTEWSEFRLPDWKKMHDLMLNHVVFDGRNIYNPAELQEIGYAYHCIGRMSSVEKLEPEV